MVWPGVGVVCGGRGVLEEGLRWPRLACPLGLWGDLSAVGWKSPIYHQSHMDPASSSNVLLHVSFHTHAHTHARTHTRTHACMHAAPYVGVAVQLDRLLGEYDSLLSIFDYGMDGLESTTRQSNTRLHTQLCMWMQSVDSAQIKFHIRCCLKFKDQEISEGDHEHMVISSNIVRQGSK